MKLALGTVQFGTDYGITNAQGQVNKMEAARIMSSAYSSGISHLDTAAAYGNSESVLGDTKESQQFRVISKVPSLDASNSLTIKQYVDASLAKLNRKSLDGLLLHNENDLLGSGARENFSTLNELKSNGIVSEIGVSFYSVEAAEKIINQFDIDLIQVPASQLDRRFEKNGILELAKSKGIEVHARSLFLQGLLAMPNSQRPVKFQDFRELQKFDETASELNITLLQLALMYLNNCELIDFGVIGCTSVTQLEEILSSYNQAMLQDPIGIDISSNNLSLINPTNW